MPKPSSDRRQFSRIHFDADTTLRAAGHSWSTQLLDISLRGALLAEPDGWTAPAGGALELVLTLADPAAPLTLRGTIVHREAGHLGMAFHDIGLDGISHLRRLVELNLADPAQLDRELEALWHHK